MTPSVFIDGDPDGCACTPLCEWPCWQRVGLTDQACCPDCQPLPPLEGHKDALSDQRESARALDEAVQIMKDARGHHGIEETAGPGQPATEWDEIADRMRMFVWRWDRAALDEGDR